MKTKVLLVLMAVFLSSAAFLNSGESFNSKKREEIRKLLILTGSDKISLLVLNQMIDSFKKADPSVPDKFWDDFAKEFNGEGLIELVIPIYDKHLSESAIKELTKFFQTKSGKEYIASMPQITQEAMLAGQKWGMEIGEKVIEQLKKEGYSKEEKEQQEQ